MRIAFCNQHKTNNSSGYGQEGGRRRRSTAQSVWNEGGGDDQNTNGKTENLIELQVLSALASTSSAGPRLCPADCCSNNVFVYVYHGLSAVYYPPAPLELLSARCAWPESQAKHVRGPIENLKLS